MLPHYRSHELKSDDSPAFYPPFKFQAKCESP
jgi:hypothetical protein